MSAGSPFTSTLVTHISSSAGAGPLRLGILTTQPEIGHAALKVGGCTGMRTFGGMALSAAKSRVVSAGSGSTLRHATGELLSGGLVRYRRSGSREGVLGNCG
jgi:hypothetical protein